MVSGRQVKKFGSSDEIRKLFAFGAVGLVAWCFYTLVVALVVESRGDPLLGVAAAWVVGTAISFFGNSRWVFKVRPATAAGYRFIVVTLAGFALNLALAWLLTRWGVHYLAMTVIIFSTVPIFNYLGHRFWTFAVPPRWVVDRQDGMAESEH